jgi:sporulation protein YlmC with PRC-barrel domain
LEASYPETYYLSTLLARKILSAEGKVLGKALDLLVDMEQPQPQVVKLVFRHSWSLERWSVNWSDVASVEQAGIRLKAGTIPTPLTT